MVKRQKEKQYQSAREQRANSQSRSGVTIGSTVQRRLPFHCCALTLVPFVNPVCTSNGIVFDNTALLPFLLHHRKDPVTGHPLTTRDIITLHMDQDDQGRWQCPVLTKPFADHSKIVAIRDGSEAYVYSYEAYKELNLKSKNYLDLTTGKKFHPQKDVIILNDPDNPDFYSLRDINSFWHITNARAKEQLQPASTNVRHSVTATRIMEQIQKEKKKRAATESTSTTSSTTASTTAFTWPNNTKKLKIFSTDVTGIQYTSGKASGSLTSTAMDVASDNTAREADPEEILQAQFQAMRNNKKKGYVQLFTNRGEILLELHCDIVPRTCTNFLGLCEANKYQNTKFHRLIPNFMIQGGKSTTDDDASLWGPAFADEFDDRLKHAGGGVVSMANAGPGTNKRQFFITFKSCAHLDRKHSIFGKVVKGIEVVQELGKMTTDKKDRPSEPVIIERTEILVNPAQEAEHQVEKEIEERAVYRRQEEQKRKANALGRTTTAATKAAQSKAKAETKNVVGKYLPKQAVAVSPKQEDDETDEKIPSPPVTRVKPPPAKSKFDNFSGW
jgi:peptidyl-prolyl cis-trans isomerase-like protein 2